MSLVTALRQLVVMRPGQLAAITLIAA